MIESDVTLALANLTAALLPGWRAGRAMLLALVMKESRRGCVGVSVLRGAFTVWAGLLAGRPTSSQPIFHGLVTIYHQRWNRNSDVSILLHQLVELFALWPQCPIHLLLAGRWKQWNIS